jgi:hypothetical protein
MPEFKMKDQANGGGYFMAREDHDTVLRRIARGHREAKEHEARLDTEAKLVAEAILRLGHALYHDPARVFFEGQAHTPHFRSDAFFRDADYPKVEQIKVLTGELREVGEERIRLAEQLERLGCDASP